MGHTVDNEFNRVCLPLQVVISTPVCLGEIFLDKSLTDGQSEDLATDERHLTSGGGRVPDKHLVPFAAAMKLDVHPDNDVDEQASL